MVRVYINIFLMYVVGTHQKHLAEAKAHNLCFLAEIRRKEKEKAYLYNFDPLDSTFI